MIMKAIRAIALTLTAFCAATAPAQAPADPSFEKARTILTDAGAWRGKISLGPMKIPVVFHFSAGADGTVDCTLDSPSQGAMGIPASLTRLTADSLTVECSAIGAVYAARIAPATISGRLSQRGVALPLVLRPDTPLADRRPQTPRPPFPYTTLDTTFVSADGTRLAATLTLPLTPSSARMPAVVMVTGSGPQNRDEELFDHRPFAVIADALARKGIASLRYDDRGTGRSTGDFAAATITDFAADARAAVAVLRTVPCIGPAGVLGHSEGGTVALMLAADSVPDFIVSIAGMAVSGKETILRQNRHALELSGLPEPSKAAGMKLIERLFDIIVGQHRAGVSGPVDVDSLAAAMRLDVPGPVMESVRAAMRHRSAALDAMLAVDASEFMGRIKCPVLAINGDSDRQVDAASNIAAIRRCIPAARTRILPGLNHMMQHCTTGEPAEYGEISETFAPEALDAITDFITSLR